MGRRKERSAGPKIKNAYRGQRVRSGWQVPTVPATISPEEFFTRFVQARSPVIIDGHLCDKEWKGHNWTLDYIAKKAGQATVQVEERTSEVAPFGLAAPKKSVPFSEFAQHVESGRLYLTTQEIPQTAQGYEELYAQPLRALQHDFPLQPALLGNLVPYQMNLWMGKAKDGSSSGLHHDYHDNLYILLQGKKRFRLFSPADAGQLYVQGAVQTIHSNGLISYSSLPTRSDGAHPVEAAALRIAKAEEELEAAESLYATLHDDPKTDKDLLQTTQERVEAAEEELEAAMEVSLNACEEENDSDGFEGDEEANEGEELPEYPNFSRLGALDQTTSGKGFRSQFPLYNKATVVECQVNAGQMLYLPASWFHEVTSYSSPEEPVHCAMNYWVYPPHHESGTFEQPYEDSYWANRWAQFLMSRVASNSPSTRPKSEEEPEQKRQKL